MRVRKLESDRLDRCPCYLQVEADPDMGLSCDFVARRVCMQSRSELACLQNERK